MEDSHNFLSVIKDVQTISFLSFLETNSIQQPIGEISTQNNPLVVKWFKNLALNLPLYNLTINGEDFESLGEIKPGVYEGGFKLWECEKDAVQYFLMENIQLQDFIKCHNPLHKKTTQPNV